MKERENGKLGSCCNEDDAQHTAEYRRKNVNGCGWI